jgi:hypothetical protein
MFGLAGAHRSGKTTTAKAIADQLGIEFLEMKTSSVFEELGISPKDDLPFAKRLEVQNAILRQYEVMYDLRAQQPFICDRTPFDVMVYTSSEIRRDTLDDDLRAGVEAHFRHAVRIINKSLVAVMMLRPLPSPPEASTSAQACPLYMDHVYAMVDYHLKTIGAVIPGFIAVESPSYDLKERIEDGVNFFGPFVKAVKPEPKIWMPNS